MSWRRRGPTAPMGQFARLRKYPDASYRDVTAPNADTLYTYAYLDLSKEPWVVSIPDLKGRFAVFSIFDGWTTVFANPGKRTTGTGAQTFAITGPGWTGTLPAGVKEYKSATQVVLFNGKIYCTGTPGGLQAGSRRAGQGDGCPALLVRQALHARAGQGRSGRRHEDAGAGPGARHGGRGLLQAVRRTPQDEHALPRRCPDGRQARQARHRSRTGLRHRQGRSRRRSGAGQGVQDRPAADRGVAEGGCRGRRLAARERLGHRPRRRAPTARTTSSAR